jgi:hypothetical protein
MFCAYCDEMIAGKSFIYDGEEYCSRECLEHAKAEANEDLDDDVIEEPEEEWVDESDEDEY